MDSLGVPETVTRVRVTKVIKGDAKVGDIIEVAQVGGTDKSGIVRRETSTTLLNEAKPSSRCYSTNMTSPTMPSTQSPECLASIPTGTSPR